MAYSIFALIKKGAIMPQAMIGTDSFYGLRRTEDNQFDLAYVRYSTNGDDFSLTGKLDHYIFDWEQPLKGDCLPLNVTHRIDRLDNSSESELVCELIDTFTVAPDTGKYHELIITLAKLELDQLPHSDALVAVDTDHDSFDTARHLFIVLTDLNPHLSSLHYT